MSRQADQQSIDEPERHVHDASLGLDCQIYGHAPVQADGRLNGRRFYFRARGSGWSFTLCNNADVEPAALRPADQPGIFTDGEFRGFALWGDYGNEFDASVMPYEEAERLIRQCVAEYLAAEQSQTKNEVSTDTAALQTTADLPTSEADWSALITAAIETPDPVLSNFRITRLHHMLSCALENAIGPDAGANFHSWAVWGSRKAGVTIRQEDKDQASRDATVVAGIVGALVGVGVGWGIASLTGWSLGWSITGWVLLGIVVGGYCGYLLAGYTRNEASRLILEGNRIVLNDIGRATARYLAYVEQANSDDGNNDAAFAEFLADFRQGPTEQNGQDLLRTAFEQYETSRRSADAKVRHECNYFANCLAVLHEHIRLQPYISRSLPFLIRKCVTERLMTYNVGESVLAVHEDVPPLSEAIFPPTLMTIDNAALVEFLAGPQGWDVARGTLANTRAKDWTNIRERMGYIVNLFRTRHLQPDLVATPYSVEQLQQIAAGALPARPW